MRNAYIMLILSAILYGSISTMAKPQLNTINPILLSSIIYLVIGVSLTIIAKLKGNIASVNGNKLKLIFIDSVCGAVIGPVLFFYGLKLTNASVASILINTGFLFSILLAVSILKERLGKTAYAGIALIFMGLIILNAKTDNSDIFQSNHFIGNMFIMSAAIFWALDNNISNIILKKGTPIIRIIQIKSLIGGSITIALVFVSNIAFSINLYQIPNLLLLSLGGFAGSLFLFLMGMREVGTVKSVMIFSTSSVFGLIFALMLLKEPMEIWNLLSSIVFIIVGIFFITKNNYKDKTANIHR
jgi:drug/metabolite transporter (DMT)-like permease